MTFRLCETLLLLISLLLLSILPVAPMSDSNKLHAMQHCADGALSRECDMWELWPASDVASLLGTDTHGRFLNGFESPAIACASLLRCALVGRLVGFRLCEFLLLLMSLLLEHPSCCFNVRFKQIARDATLFGWRPIE